MSFLKYSPCETMHLCRRVFQLSKQLWNPCKVMPCRAIVVFAFTLSKSSKWFPLRSFSFWGPGKGHRVPNPVNREGGSVGSCIFCPKLSDTQGGVRWHTVAMKSPLPALPPVGEFSSHRVSHAAERPSKTSYWQFDQGGTISFCTLPFASKKQISIVLTFDFTWQAFLGRFWDNI